MTVCVLSAGRESPSKRHATDLRDLRMVSYFLGSASSGGGGATEVDPLRLKCRVKGHCTTTVEESSVDVSTGGGGGLYMSSNILVDLEGTLAVSLLKLTTVIVPFDKVAVQSISGVSVAKYLAALNGSMVGVVLLPRANENNMEVPIVSHQLIVPSGDAIERSSSSSSVTVHTIPSIPGAKLLPCLGVAVVKCVDVVNQYFAITAPPTTVRRIVEATTTAPARDNSTSRFFDQSAVSTISIALVKGEASQQLPNVLLYAPGSVLMFVCLIIVLFH